MLAIRIGIALLFLSFLSTTVLGQANEADSIDSVKRFIDQQTIAVLSLDLRKLDVDNTVEQVSGMLGITPDRVQRNKALLSAAAGNLLKRKVTQVHAIYSHPAMTNFPTLVVPLADATEADKVASLISHGSEVIPFSPQGSWIPNTSLAKRAVGNLLLIGPAEELERLAKVQPVNRPEFTSAMRQPGAATLRIWASPPVDFKKVMAELHPRLPVELGGMPTSEVLQGMKWGGVKVDFPPGTQVKITLEASSPNDVVMYQKLWWSYLGLLKKWSEEEAPSKALMQMTHQFLAKAKWSNEGSTIQLELEKEQFAQVVVQYSAQFAKTATDQLNRSHLRQFVVAMHNYHGDFNHLPNQAIVDKNGKPLLSWRVNLLPYLGQMPLYKEFKLDEPWDSDHNKKLLSKIPQIYKHPYAKDVPEHHTLYQVFYSKKGVKPSAMIWETGKIDLGKVTLADGTSNTMLISDAAATAVPWTKPEDLLFDVAGPMPKLGSPGKDNLATACFGDGSAYKFRIDGKSKLLQQMIGYNDGWNESTEGVVK